MKVGYFMMPLHDPERDYHTTLEEDAEAIIYADELGYEEAWLGEHYSSGAEQITSPLIFHANLIARTKRIKLATGVVCLPQYHPAVTAGQCAMFDHLSKGRFILGVGPGGLPSDFELFGVAEMDRNEMMVEALDQILHLWQTEPPYDVKGKYWSYGIHEWYDQRRHLGYVAKPYQQPHPPIAISGMSPASGSIKMAGSRGYIPVSANFVGNWVVKSHWPKYVEGADESGITADSDIWRVARSIYVDDSDRAAQAFVNTAGSPFDFYFEYLWGLFEKANITKGFVVNAGDDPSKMTHRDLVEGFVIHGSPETVAQKILDLREDVGDFGTLLYAAHDWLDKSRMRNSMRLMAEEVMPRINKAISA